MANLAVQEVPASPVPILTDDELTALIKACTGPRFYARRDEAVIRFLLDTGTRVSELRGLHLSDVDLDHEMVMMTGKGRRTRPVYFGARTGLANGDNNQMTVARASCS